MKTFTDYMREADGRELPDLRMAFIEYDTAKWGGEKPPCCAVGGANICAGVPYVVGEDGFVLRGMQVNSVPEWLDAASISGKCHLCGSAMHHGWPPHLYDEHGWSRTQIADYIDATYGRDHDETDWQRRVGLLSQ